MVLSQIAQNKNVLPTFKSTASIESSIEMLYISQIKERE